MVVAALAVAQVATAQPLQKSQGADGEQLTSQLVRTGLYVIAGSGANSLLRFTAGGSILIDGKRPGHYRALMSVIRRISRFSDHPVRVLVLTDHHENRTGTNPQFLAAGVQIIAQENARRHLSAQEPESAQAAARMVAYGRDYTVRLGRVEVHLKHFGSARTGGDTVVYFPHLRVVAVGDLFTQGTPVPDFAAGGSLVNWGPVLDRVLELDFDVVVPSAGPTVTRADLEAFKTRIDTLTSRGIALVRKGVAKHDLMAELETADLGWRLSFTGDALDRFYTELSQAK
jgi:cyclase